MPATTRSVRVCRTTQKIIERIEPLPTSPDLLGEERRAWSKEDLVGRQSVSYSQSPPSAQKTETRSFFGASTKQNWRRHFRCPSSSIVIVYHNEWGDKFDHVREGDFTKHARQQQQKYLDIVTKAKVRTNCGRTQREEHCQQRHFKWNGSRKPGHFDWLINVSIYEFLRVANIYRRRNSKRNFRVGEFHPSGRQKVE